MTRKNEAAAPKSLTPAMFHVLLALADGEKHGYAILKEVARRTSNKVRLSAGTLYGNLARLQSAGFIAESASRPVASLDDERRRYYRLTDFGREVAIAEAERMEEAVAQARAKNLFRKPKLARTRIWRGSSSRAGSVRAADGTSSAGCLAGANRGRSNEHE